MTAATSLVEKNNVTLDSELSNYIMAGYPALYIVTAEESRAYQTIKDIAERLAMTTVIWTATGGFDDKGSPIDPVSAILSVADFEDTIVCYINFHFYMSDPTVIQAIKDIIPVCKANGNTLAFISARLAIPTELEKELTVLEYKLPDEQELQEILVKEVNGMYLYLPDGSIDKKATEQLRKQIKDKNLVKQVAKAGLGLTINEFLNAITLSIKCKNKIDPEIIRDQKAQLVARNPALRFSTFKGGFETLAGLENLKNFAKRIVESGKGRGLLVLGVPGTGKSHFAQCLGNETNRPTLMLDFGLLMSSYVGETEQRTKEALDIADAMAPCILFIDEIEKGLAGVSKGAYVGDSGVSQRQGGIFLKWLQDHESDVFVVATCNDISTLPSPYLRAERWDAIFFVDLPNAQERKAIFQLYKDYYKLTDEQCDIKDIVKFTENWTGAEIRSLCRLASALNATLSEASIYIKPIFETMRAEIEQLREWAKHRAVPASATPTKAAGRRKIRAAGA